MQEVPTIKTAEGPYYDANSDGWVAADDVLEIINHINAFGADDPTDPGTPAESALPLTTSLTQPASAPLPLDDLITLLATDVADSAKRRK